MRLLLGFVLLAQLAGAVDSENKAADLKVLFLIDNESELMGDNLNAACDLNMNLLHRAFTDAATQTGKTYQAWGLRGFSLNSASIAKTFQRMQGPTQTLLVYYCGHGVIENGEPVFTTSGGRIARRQVQRELSTFGAELTVLFSDTCSQIVRGRTALGPASRTTGQTEILSDLLFRSRGRVDLTAAKMGQIAWFHSGVGGAFTSAFVDTYSRPRANFDANRDGRVSWREIWAPLAIHTQAQFEWIKSLCPSDHKIHAYSEQMPFVWALAD